MGNPGNAGRGRRFWLFLCLVPFFYAGCVSDRASVEKKLLTELPSPEEKQVALHGYRVACPDVLEVRVINRPDLHWTVAVDVDGAFPVNLLGRPPVEGHTLEEIAKTVATRLGMAEKNVLVEVSEYRSKRIYVFGEVKGAPQAIPYRGPETVSELLQRLGGITSGAEPAEVYVVRSNIAEGKRPEFFHVDLRAIVLKKDNKTNIRLQPFDQVHVGETPEALVERCIPKWMRPFHWALWDTRPADRPPLGILQKRLHDARRDMADRRAEEKSSSGILSVNHTVTEP